jgi:3',5'-cyclic AMP phosphodiesterase CpdA
MRIAHISDLHLLSLEGLEPRRLLGKRFTGWVNIKMKRGAVHKLFAAQAVAREIRERGIDHVVVTGDLTNLSLESEFELARAFLETDLGLPPDRVSVVPGNHDVYTRGAYRSRRFQCYLGDYITSDLPGASGVPGAGRFPYVRLRGPVAIIGVSTALPRPPLVATGEVGHLQRQALHALLEHDEVRRRTPVLLQHHPWHRYASFRKQAMHGLMDAAEERVVLGGVRRGLLLHGHLHRRVHRIVDTDRGRIDAVATTSASQLSDDPLRMSGFNLYDIDDGGAVTGIESWRLERDTGRFVPAPVPLES